MKELSLKTNKIFHKKEESVLLQLRQNVRFEYLFHLAFQEFSPKGFYKLKVYELKNKSRDIDYNRCEKNNIDIRLN